MWMEEYMKKSQKMAALMVLFGMLALAIGPVQNGPWPFPDDDPSPSGNVI
jgi:hypothetical protein